MSSYLIYLLKVCCTFTVLYAFYYLFLRRLTFHGLNRFYLLGLLFLAATLPMLEVHYVSAVLPVQPIPAFDELMPLQAGENTISGGFSGKQYGITGYALFLYLTGVLVFAFKFIRNTLSVFRLKRKSPSTRVGKCYFVKADVPVIFSCFNWIFIPENRPIAYDNPVIEHEKSHVGLRHTFDLILTELFVVLLWFFPFVYLFRRSIKAVHEFQADAKVVGQKGVQQHHYLELMLNSLKADNLVGLYSYFNLSTIKKRVEMITTNKSTKKQLATYFLILPVLAVLTMAFSPSPKDNVPSIFPIEKGQYKRIASKYGKRLHPIYKTMEFHGGIDITAKKGTPIKATADGVIAKASKNKKGRGNFVVIQHGKTYETWYTHLQKFIVKEGQKVKKGEVIGYVGNTGMSTAPHLHYEVQKNGKRVNPENYIE